jgi:hypothetical protein
MVNTPLAPGEHTGGRRSGSRGEHEGIIGPEPLPGKCELAGKKRGEEEVTGYGRWPLDAPLACFDLLAYNHLRSSVFGATTSHPILKNTKNTEDFMRFPGKREVGSGTSLA